MRLNDRFSGPLTGLPHPHRKVIANSVVRGRVVENQTDAATAIAYALWMGRWCKWIAIVFAVVGLAQIVTSAILRDWFQLGLGALFVGLGAFYGWMLARLRRSVSLNEAIA